MADSDKDDFIFNDTGDWMEFDESDEPLFDSDNLPPLNLSEYPSEYPSESDEPEAEVSQVRSHAKKKSGGRIFLRVLEVVVIVALVAGCVVAFLIHKQNSDQIAAQAEALSKGVDITVSAPGWSSDKSTPYIIHVQGKVSADAYIPAGAVGEQAGVSAGDSYEAYFALDANGLSHLDLPEGSYTITAISPINADGSVYQTPEPGTISVGRDQAATREDKLVLYTGENSTAERSSAVLASINEAIAKAASLKTSSAFSERAQTIKERAVANVAVIVEAERIAAELAAAAEEEAATVEDAATTDDTASTGSTSTYYYTPSSNTTATTTNDSNASSSSASTASSASSGSYKPVIIEPDEPSSDDSGGSESGGSEE